MLLRLARLLLIAYYYPGSIPCTSLLCFGRLEPPAQLHPLDLHRPDCICHPLSSLIVHLLHFVFLRSLIILGFSYISCLHGDFHFQSALFSFLRRFVVGFQEVFDLLLHLLTKAAFEVRMIPEWRDNSRLFLGTG